MPLRLNCAVWTLSVHCEGSRPSWRIRPRACSSLLHEPRRTYSRYAPARIRSPPIVVVASMLNGAPPQRRPFGKFPPPPPLGLVACLTRKLTVPLRVKRPVWLLTRHGRGRTPSKSWRKRVKSREADAQLRPLTVIVYGPAGS